MKTISRQKRIPPKKQSVKNENHQKLSQKTNFVEKVPQKIAGQKRIPLQYNSAPQSDKYPSKSNFTKNLYVS